MRQIDGGDALNIMEHGQTARRVNLLMQRNAVCSYRIAFGLGIKADRDYGRAPRAKGLYLRRSKAAAGSKARVNVFIKRLSWEESRARAGFAERCLRCRQVWL